MQGSAWGHCPDCDRWFFSPDITLESYALCPVCLTTADRFRGHENVRRLRHRRPTPAHEVPPADDAPTG